MRSCLGLCILKLKPIIKSNGLLCVLFCFALFLMFLRGFYFGECLLICSILLVCTKKMPERVHRIVSPSQVLCWIIKEHGEFLWKICSHVSGANRGNRWGGGGRIRLVSSKTCSSLLNRGMNIAVKIAR